MGEGEGEKRQSDGSRAMEKWRQRRTKDLERESSQAYIERERGGGEKREGEKREGERESLFS